jgi:hypothetical protein
MKWNSSDMVRHSVTSILFTILVLSFDLWGKKLLTVDIQMVTYNYNNNQRNIVLNIFRKPNMYATTMSNSRLVSPFVYLHHFPSVAAWDLNRATDNELFYQRNLLWFYSGGGPKCEYFLNMYQMVTYIFSFCH